MISFDSHLKTAQLGAGNSKPPQQTIKDGASQPETNQSEHKAGKCLTLKRERLRNSSQPFVLDWVQSGTKCFSFIIDQGWVWERGSYCSNQFKSFKN